MVTEDKTEVGLDINEIIGEKIVEETWGAMVDKIAVESIETIIEMTVMTEAGTGLEEGCLSRNYSNNRNRSTSNSRSRSGWRASKIETEFSVISVGNMIISWRTVQLPEKKKK